jgi:hypothetical protein
LSTALIVKTALIAAIVLVAAFDVLLAAFFFLAWLHYDGGDVATNATIQGWMYFCLIGPVVACLYPLKLPLRWRLLVVLLVSVVGSYVALTVN